MFLLKYVICLVHTTIYTERLIFGNKTSLNISQDMLNKWSNYELVSPSDQINDKTNMYKYKFSQK